MPNRPPTYRPNKPKSHDERPSASARGYGSSPGSRWQRLRALVLSQQPWCAVCGDAAKHVDHIIPKPEGDNSFANLQPLCHACHSRKTKMERDPDVQARRLVVCGPPAAGKTRWVQERVRPGDIVWDQDAVAQSLCGLAHGPQFADLLQLLGRVRQTVVDWLAKERCDGKVYIIITDEAEARRIAGLVRASVVVLATPAEECIGRILADSTRLGNATGQIETVKAWWGRRQEG